MQRDPIGYEGGLNLYNYVGQNPINRIDPVLMDHIDLNRRSEGRANAQQAAVI